MPPFDNPIRAVAYQQDGMWIVQGIEYDVRARVDSLMNVSKAFLRALHERTALNEHRGKSPLDGIKAAPTKFAEMFAAGHPIDATDADNKVEVRLPA